MLIFIFLLIVAGVGAGLLVTALWGATGSYPRWPFATTGGFLLVIALASILASSLVTVGPSDVGIVTAFGKTVGSDLGPGIHPVWPWDSVTVWDDSVQHQQFAGRSCLVIRIAGQQRACLDVNIFWRDDRSQADAQFKAYRTFGRLQNAFMSRGVVVRYFNNRFEAYDPVALASLSAAGKQTGATVSQLSEQVLADIRTAYAGQLTITQLATGSPDFGPEVESALNKVVSAKANVNVALQNRQAARYQAGAARKLAGVLTPVIVEHECVTTTQTLSQAGNALPPAWTCTGGGAGVIVSQGK